MGTTSYQSPPDLDADGRRAVARRHVPSDDGGDGVRQQVPLQLVRDPALAVIGTGADHDRADLFRQLLGQDEILLGEAPTRPGGDEGDGAEDLLLAQAERHRHVRGEFECLQNVVMPFLAARAPEEFVVHVGAPHRPAAAHDLHGRMDTLRVGRVRGAQLLGERSLVRIRVPRSHPSHLAVLVHDVDEAEIRHDGDRDPGEPLDHLAVVDDLGEHLGGQQEELVVAPGFEELLDQLLAFGRLRRRVQELPQVVADGVHELDLRGVRARAGDGSAS